MWLSYFLKDGWADWTILEARQSHCEWNTSAASQWFNDLMTPKKCLDLCLQSDGTRFKLVTTPATTPQFWVLWIHQKKGQKTGYHGYQVIRRQWLGSSGRTKSRCIQLNSLRLPTLRRTLWLAMSASKMWHWNIPFFLRENMFFIHFHSSIFQPNLMEAHAFNIQLHLIKATFISHAARKRCKLAVMAAKNVWPRFFGAHKNKWRMTQRWLVNLDCWDVYFIHRFCVYNSLHHPITYWCVLRREWMGCWGLLGLFFLVIMDHSLIPCA